MDLKVLGMFDVRVGGVPVAPSASKPRQLLATLAVHAGQVVSVGALIGELWGAKPPRSAQATLQTYVMQLRGAVGTALEAGGGSAGDAKRILVTRPGGYLLDRGNGTSDAQEFERLSGTAFQALADRDDDTAARALRAALGLWRGPAFGDVQAGALLALEARRLEEARLCVQEHRIELDLRQGRHRELIGELSVLVQQHRTHENLHAHLMLALYRSSRRTEALGVYQRLRGTLVHELGLEPSEQLRELQHAVLTASPKLLDVPEADGRRLIRVG
ncbi:BTAD domain-containing putative transcriptional regulator [Streptomyces sp. NPDC098101]|uniref:AfsR/SARP family transcriptional regulator n=1 Tax=Streptomyces sp. NPDC098101 TaxID=3366096 RepID=UPI00381DA49A